MLPQILPWTPPPSDLVLARDQVDIWLLDENKLTSAETEHLASYLSAEERPRADRFRHPAAKAEFIRTRGWLRHVLARYLQAIPERLQFAYGPHGKPRLANHEEGQGICFNVSHSHGIALLAVARDRLIGVDVEKVRINKDLDGLARRYFSANEVTSWEQLSPEQRSHAFFLAWTRKEAFIKALGSGMSFPLDAFDVSLTPGEPARLLAVRSSDKQPSDWTMLDVQVGEEFAGAAAVMGTPKQIRRWQ
jgi:4'-phosphopantetheinyl transferase